MSESLPRNARLFCWFRVLFNARFYYPVLAVFFVDMGLTLDEFAILNVAWAASIVFFELPLGALADRIGRRPLVVAASAIMVLEMAVLAFAPVGDPRLLFWVFFVNRILSGMAEAAASGADEALAFDTLVEEGRPELWPQVLARMQRAMAVAFMGSMIIGAAVYDHKAVNTALGWIGIDAQLDQMDTVRFPVYLTLGLALGALAVSLRMREPHADAGGSLRDSLRATLGAGRWIVATPFAFAVILYSVLIDSPGRIIVTLASSVYRMIHVPEALFGFLGAMLGAVGFVAPAIATRLMRICSPWLVYLIIAALMLSAAFGISTGVGWLVIACMALLGISFNLLGFFTSHYLNLLTPSASRATVLSFRSLAGNLSYGVFGGLFAVALRWAAGGERPEPGSAVETEAFARTLGWIPVLFLLLLIPVFARSRRVRSMCLREEPGSV